MAIVRSINLIVSAINPTLEKIAIVAVIIILGMIVGKLLGLFVKSMLKWFHADKTVKNLSSNIGLLVSVIIYVVTIIISLDYLRILSVSAIILLVLICAFILINLLIWIKDVIVNLFAGISIKKRINFAKGITKVGFHKIGLLGIMIIREDETAFIPYSFIRRGGFKQ